MGRYSTSRRDTLPGIVKGISRDLRRGQARSFLGAVGDEADPTTVWGQITNLTLTSSVRRDRTTGRDTALVTMDWTKINDDPDNLSEETDPRAAKIKEYLTSYTVDGAKYTAEQSTISPPVTYEGLPLDQPVTFRVRARSTSGMYGPYVSATTTTAKDTTAPGKPAAPTLEPLIRGLAIKWSGKTSTGENQPPDFARCDIHLSQANNFTPSPANKIGEFTTAAGGQHSWGDSFNGSRVYYVKLVSYDFSGNASPPSDEVSSLTEDALGFNSLIGGGNLTRNGSFEQVNRNTSGSATGLKHWSGNGTFNTDYTQDATLVRFGGFSMRVSATAYIFRYQDYVLPPGKYLFSCYVRSSAGATSTAGAGVAIEFVSGSGTIAETTRFTTEQVSDSWSRSIVRFSTSTNATVRGIVTNSYGGTSAGNWYFDGCQMEEGEFITAFAPQPGEVNEGQVTSFEIADFAIGTNEIAQDAVVADKIRANNILAKHVAAGQITASKITITNITNALHDASFELETIGDGGTGGSWSCQSGWRVINTSSSRTGTRCAQFVGGTAAITNAAFLPVSPGERYVGSGWFNSSGASAGRGAVRLLFYNASRQYLRLVEGNSIGAGTAGYARSVVEAQVPGDASYMVYDAAVYSNNGTSWLFDDTQLRRMNDGELIVDGSISASKITAGAITTDKLTVGAVSADNLVANNSFEDKGGPLVADKWYRFAGDAFRVADGNTISGSFSLGMTNCHFHSSSIPVTQGEVYYAAANVRQPNGGGGVYFRMSLYTGDPGNHEYGSYGQGHIIDIVANAGYGAGISRAEGQFTVPGGYKVLKVSLITISNTLTVWDDVVVRKVTGSTQIQDGAITTNKIAANQITANHIVAGQITAGHISATGISADSLTSGSIVGRRYATGTSGEYRIELLDGGTKDTIRWITSTGVIAAEMRGTMNDGRLGVYINSTCQIGNNGSSIHQVGFRSTRSGAISLGRVRADHVFLRFVNGNARVTFPVAMTQAPTMVVCTFSTSPDDGRFAIWRVANFTSTGFDVNMQVQNSTTHLFGAPGGEPRYYVSYYAEICN